MQFSGPTFGHRLSKIHDDMTGSINFPTIPPIMFTKKKTKEN